jgi:hypothetical protein
MATVQIFYTGNGAQVLFSFPFAYLDASHVKAEINGTPTSAFTLANATTVEFNTAPANGASIKIFRETDNDQSEATIFSGSSIRAVDLNRNNTQLLYLAQETDQTAEDALTSAGTAISTANAAVVTANAAVVTANAADANASAAVITANAADANASAAVITANTAESNSLAAISTANSASAAVASAVIYQPVVDLTALGLLTPADGDFFELQDSTGAESDPDITDVPVGLVGAAGLTFRLRYDDPPQEYVFLGYFANDSETRYLKLSGGTLTGQLLGDNSTSAATPGFAFDGDPNTGVLRPGADELALVTAGTSRLTIDSAGAVNVPGALSQNSNAVVVTTDSRLTDTRTPTDSSVTDAKVSATAAIAGTKISPDFGSQNIVTTGTNTAASFIPTGSSVPTNGVYLPAANSVGVATNGAEALRVDSSGRLLVGTSSSPSAGNGQYARAVVQGNTFGAGAGILNVQSSIASASVASGDNLGFVQFTGNDGNVFASIKAQADAATSAGDFPGRLLFSTTADGASSPTERMRIANNGAISTVVPGGSTLYPAFDCRAWVNFDGTGTVAIRASGNVSSITDNGTGRYQVNFATAMPDTNYSVSLSARRNTNTLDANFNGVLEGSTSANTNFPMTTTDFKIQCGTPSNNLLLDTDLFCASVFR